MTQSFAAKFSDVGDLGREIGFDMAFRQLNPGVQDIPARIIASENLAILNMGFNCGYHQRALAPAGRLSFGLPEEGVEDWFGLTYPDNGILPFNHASGFDVVSRPGFRAYSISVEEGLIREISEMSQIPVAEILYKPRAGELILDSQSVRDFRAMVRSLFLEDQPCVDKERETALVVALLQAALGEVGVTERSKPAARSRAVESALDYVHEQGDDMLTVDALCGATDVPLRTLSRAFKERFGIGPKAYVKQLRLGAVRTQLLTCEERVLISDIANSQGFWHMGQFAADYKRLFGELPSETLQKR